MPDTLPQFEARFHLYPTDVSLFLEYCSRSNVLQNLDMKLCVDEERDPDYPDIFTYRASFVATVNFSSEMARLVFGNIFTLFFKTGKWLPNA